MIQYNKSYAKQIKPWLAAMLINRLGNLGSFIIKQTIARISQWQQQKYQMIEWIKKATTGNISGNYKFHVKTEPSIVDTSTTITVTPFTDRTEQAIVPCHYRWFRARNGLTEQATRFKGNSYVCDSSDIGATIQVQVTSNDPQFSGKANVEFGPVKLSLQIKKHLMDTLASGSTFVKGMIYITQYMEKECQFKIFEDLIKICHLQSELNYSFTYSSSEPRIQVNPKDPTKIAICFSQAEPNLQVFIRKLFGQQLEQAGMMNNQCRIQVRFAKRQIKDIFLLTLRGFFTKKQLKNSVIVHKIEEASFNQHSDINLIFQLESLRADVARLYTSNEQKEREKQRMNQQIFRLQRDIEEIITTYTRIADEKVKNIKDLNQSYAILINKKEDVFGRKCQFLEEQNNNLNERIKLLTAEVDQIRFNTSIAKKNQTINSNFTHVTPIRMMNSQVGPRNQATSFENILEHLSQSKVTDFNEDNFKMGKQLERVSEERNQLQKKLQKSFKAIDDLEKKLKNQPNITQSAVVNFNKKDFPAEINSSFYSLTVDLEKIQAENNQLKLVNESLRNQNFKLHNEIKSGSSSRIIIKPLMMTSNQNMKAAISTNNNNILQLQNQTLKKQAAALKQSLTSEQAKTERLLKDKIMLERKVQELNNQISMYRKNQEVLNRSQYLSMEMENYNQEKLNALQANNDFLIAENEKLSKALEKYMAEARENIKLRKQLLEIKQRAGKNTLNPQKVSKNGLDASNCNISQYSEILEKL